MQLGRHLGEASSLRSRESKIYSAGAVCLGLLLFLGTYFVYSYQNLNQQALDAHQTVDRIVSLSLSFERAESGFRAYLLTHDGRYLKRYHVAAESVWREISQLEEKVHKNPEQNETLQKLKKAAQSLYGVRDDILKEEKHLKPEKLIERFVQSSIKQVRDQLTALQVSMSEVAFKAESEAGVQILVAMSFLFGALILALWCFYLHRRFVQNSLNDNYTQSFFLQSILENLNDGLIVLDVKGRNLHMNRSVSTLLGIDLTGMGLEDLFKQFDVLDPITEKAYAFHELPLYRALQGGETKESEILVRRKSDQQSVILKCRAQALYNQDQKIVAAMCIYRDITQKKKMEMDASVARQVTLEAARLKSDFLIHMGHEIRTPMNGVLGLSNTLLGTKLDPEQMKLIKSIKSSAQFLLHLIHNILDRSRLEKRELVLEPTPVRLRDLLQDVFEVSQNMAQARRLQFHMESELPLHFSITADGIRLQQVLLNILETAFQKTKKGFVSFKVEVLEYYDNKTRIYFEVTCSSREKDLASKDLDLSKKIVEMFGGEIESSHHSNLGMRTWFTLDFDYNSADFQDETLASFEGEKPILVAEDQAINQIVIKKYLEKLGLNCVVVTDGQAAFEQARTNDYSLVLMDCKMHPVSGYEATRMIRECEKKSGAHVPILALTADGSLEDRKRCHEVGMDDYIVKPVDLVKLDFHLRKWLKPTLKKATVNKLSGLELDGKPLFEVLAQEYFEQAPKQIQEIEKHLRAQDLAQLHYWAHALKSASLVLGLVEISSHCERLEGISSFDETTLKTFETIKEAYGKSEAALKKALPQSGA